MEWISQSMATLLLPPKFSGTGVLDHVALKKSRPPTWIAGHIQSSGRMEAKQRWIETHWFPPVDRWTNSSSFALPSSLFPLLLAPSFPAQYPFSPSNKDILRSLSFPIFSPIRPFLLSTLPRFFHLSSFLPPLFLLFPTIFPSSSTSLIISLI